MFSHGTDAVSSQSELNFLFYKYDLISNNEENILSPIENLSVLIESPVRIDTGESHYYRQINQVFTGLLNAFLNFAPRAQEILYVEVPEKEP